MEQACITTTQHMLLMKSIFIINMKRQERQFSKSSVSEEVCLCLSISLGVSHVTDTQNSQILLPVNTRVLALKMIATVCLCVAAVV
jgi:hypothetical protein